MYENYLSAWLPFNNSPTEDLCGNTWTAVGNPTIGANGAVSGNALQLNASSYLKLDGSLELGGQDFTICGWAKMTAATNSYGGIFMLSAGTKRIGLCDYTTRTNYVSALRYSNSYSMTGTKGTDLTNRFHFELGYEWATDSWYVFINGVRIINATNPECSNTTFTDVYIGYNAKGSSAWNGSIDEFQIYDGILLHTEDFTPPTAKDYAEQQLELIGTTNMSLSFDVARKVINPLKTWRYVNIGDSDDLIVDDVVFARMSEFITRTGVCFYQTEQAKCFDLPATSEVWLKFDVYFNSAYRWRAYNGGANGVTGITAQTSGNLSFFSNVTNVGDFSNVCVAEQLQTVLLHMISGSSAGIIEAWVDGTKIYTYTGDVNHGQDFSDIYLQSDGARTWFSNVIISNVEVDLSENCFRFSADVMRRIENRIEISFDVARHLVEPFRVPFIGEHFNHLIPTFSVFRDRLQKFVLPKRSKVYVRCTGEGVIRVFSDTDTNGIITGTDFSTQGCMYAELEACNSVFIEISPKTTPLQVIKIFVQRLQRKSANLGSENLNLAVKYATGGKFATVNALVTQFFDDLNNADSYEIFLRDYCDIILGNADTGAITGSDAGDAVTKTAQSVVPETIPVKDWVVPEKGSVADIEGARIQYPATGANGSLNATEKHILAGLNSVWIEQALKLIESSLGVSLKTLDTITKIKVNFVHDSDTPFTAYVQQQADSSGYWLALVINMAFYGDIDKSSEDGRLIPSSPNYYAAGYLDRVIAHELTHAVLLFSDPPLFLEEGAAELVHGIDDLREGDIIDLLTTRKSDLAEVFRTGGTTDNADPYAAGYLFLRYLAKQGQGYDNDITSVPAEITVNNLLISDGAIDSDYNALTDNTRQIFSADVSRALFKMLSIPFDVAIRTVIRVSFTADVSRAVLTNLILFPIDSEIFLNGLRKSPARLNAKAAHLKAAKQNTQGLQSFEVTLSEQQITEQVKFTGIIPFDIMQKVNGQYLDYHFDMRVERVQQEGIMYRCECCSDLDQLLFTQLAYKIPPSTWRKVGADNNTVEIQTYYPPATAHVQKIASALGLTPVMQFDNFLSTVLIDDLGGVTYNDLIRDVFGWSSRVPHQLINCYIRDGKLFVIQRGHESHTIDISDAKKTMPVITKELVRTTWGSTPWSKTETTEFQYTGWQAGIPDDVTISGSSDTQSGGSDTQSGGSDTQSGGSDIPMPSDDEEEEIREVSTQFTGKDYQGYTIYTYNRKGLLTQTYTSIGKDINNRLQHTHTTVHHYYDEDNTMIGTRTFTQSYGVEGSSSSLSREEKGYVTLPNGEKFLAWEKSETYQNDKGLSITDDDLVDFKVTTHSPSRAGQSHTVTVTGDGDIVGGVAGQNTGDDRVTPFSKYTAAMLGKKLFSSSSSSISGGSSGGSSGSNSGGSSGGSSGSNSGGSSGGSSSSGEWTTDKETWELTTNGLSLYDSSFPIHNEATLIKVTKALKWLNRKTQETLNISLYEFPHLIDFDDRVVFNGNEYFLVNNTATTTPRIFNEQNLTLVRWY